MNDIPMSTIALAGYQTEPYSQKAPDSVANQTFRDFEVICHVEYLKAGIIPAFPDEDESMEVVDNPALTCHTNEDAARIPDRMLDDEAFRQEKLRQNKERAKAFSIDHCMEIQLRILDSIMGAST